MKRTALITGGSRGIGLTISQIFKSNGIEVIIPSRHEMDLLSNESINNYLKSLNCSVDILINNAGINPIEMFEDITDKNIDETIQVNLLAPVYLSKNLIPKMIKQKFGRIVNISSIWSTVSKPQRTVYSMTKAGINGLTRSMAIELAEHNILVNAVAPGFVNTELTRQNNSKQKIQAIVQNIPIKRVAEPEEIAELVYFLCSQKNTYLTGQTIFIDGGYTCL